jgi:hypothetical protein
MIFFLTSSVSLCQLATDSLHCKDLTTRCPSEVDLSVAAMENNAAWQRAQISWPRWPENVKSSRAGARIDAHESP